MFKIIPILLLFLSVSAFAQVEKYNAPVNWERYKISDKGVSVLFPKLPTLISSVDVCRQINSDNYTAYAENIVYSFRITTKSKEKIPRFCTNGRKFGRQNFDERLNELKLQLKEGKETKFNRNGVEIVKLENEFFAYWLINDFDNQRFFELRVTDTDETKGRIGDFLNSLKMEKNPSGIEIGEGSAGTLGDETANEINADINENETKSGAETLKLRIVDKPRANYTDLARQKNTQGTVSLRVTFLASGGIGNISVITNLQHGLTEQAIIAARKIAFVPTKKNGMPVSVIKTVQYSFVIY